MRLFACPNCAYTCAPQVVFGTGDSMKAITLTANVNFVRAAQDQGAHFAVFTHPSRALTEMKGVP